jgi:hypothetical protein
MRGFAPEQKNETSFANTDPWSYEPMNRPLRYAKYTSAALLTAAAIMFANAAAALTHPDPDTRLLESIYTGSEYLRYDITWSDTIKAGVLHMEIIPIDPVQEKYLVKVSARSAGLLKFFYPVEDSFEIIVEGRDRLPVIMEQNDSRQGSQRLTTYNQETLEVRYSRDQEPTVIYPIEGPVHNEFSSFLILRTLPLEAGLAMMVPTFADKQRHEVAVVIAGQEQRQSMLGAVDTIKVQPQVPFQGLYQKMGNPSIWLTKDDKRIPVRIEAKIKIGSLTAELTDYRREEAAPPIMTAIKK